VKVKEKTLRDLLHGFVIGFWVSYLSQPLADICGFWTWLAIVAVLTFVVKAAVDWLREHIEIVE